jgi:FkbM family methyltransferase
VKPLRALWDLSERILGERLVARLRLRKELGQGEAEIALLSVLADRQGTFVDAGANKGVYSYGALKHFAAVVAIEPHPHLSRRLKRLLKGKGKVLPVALSDSVGLARLHIPVEAGGDVHSRSSLEVDANAGLEQREIEVERTTLDELGLRMVSLIKIDVEGHELAVLKGATNLLRSQAPVCIVECEERHRPGAVAELFAFFAGIGFDGWFIHQGRLNPIEHYDIAVYQRLHDAKKILSSRSARYVNNFIFAHPRRAEAIRDIETFLARRRRGREE